MTTRNLPIMSGMKHEFRRFVFRTDTTMTAVIQEIIREYVRFEFDVPTPEHNEFDDVIKYVIPDEWEAARLRAQREGVDMTAVIRYRIAEKLEAGLSTDTEASPEVNRETPHE